MKSRPQVFGRDVDDQTRCAHWHSPIDIIAIRMACCGRYYSCRECHDELADHPAGVWREADFGAKAILCGACGHELTIAEYMAGDSRCPACRAGFNPGCKTHRRFYFAD